MERESFPGADSSCILYKDGCIKKSIPLPTVTKKMCPSTVWPDAYCLVVLRGESLREEIVSIPRTASLEAELSRKNTQDVHLLVCLELKI